MWEGHSNATTGLSLAASTSEDVTRPSSSRIEGKRERVDSIVKEQKATGYVKGGGSAPRDTGAALSSVDESGRFLTLENHVYPPCCRINRGNRGNAASLPTSGRSEPHSPSAQ